MKILLQTLISCFIAVFLSCNEQKKIKAKIFERKHLPQNKLQIKYQYVAGGNSYTDSTIVDNKILESDSIIVLINKDDPSKSSPQ